MEKLALLISKNNLKIRLNEEYIHASYEAYKISNDENKYKSFKKELKNNIIDPAFNKIDDENVSFNESIDIFNEALEEISYSVTALYPNNYSNSSTFNNQNYDDLISFDDDMVSFDPSKDISNKYEEDF